MEEYSIQVQDVYKTFDVYLDKANSLKEKLLFWNRNRKEVREVLKVSQEPISLETPVGEEDESNLGNFIPDEDAPSPAAQAADVLLREHIEDVMQTLTPREAKVLKLRFGLEDGKARTLEEVGKEFDVTRERIRQIEAKALRKLRHPSRSKKLRDYMN